MEVRQLSSKVAAAHGTLQPHHQYGLFATTACSEGDVILTESSPLLSSSSSISVRSQFKASSLATPPPAATANAASAFEFGESKSSTDGKILSSILSDLILPQKQLSSLSSYDKDFDAVTHSQRISKLRGMILALASYAANQPSEEAKEKLLKLHYPSIKSPESYKKGSPTKDAIILAQAAMFCAKEMAAPQSVLSSLLQWNDDDDDGDKNYDLAIKLLLIYSCNSFEGGRIYHKLSRVNHSCNPNAVVVEGDSSDISVLKAACDIAVGDEITISYLGKYLFAGYPIRQRLLRANKHFACRCARCTSDSVGEENDAAAKTGRVGSNKGDLASRIPCPICHPRTGRYLDEDVMFDEDANDDNGLRVCYAIPANGMTAEERPLYCQSCKGTTTAVVPEGGGSMNKKKEGMAIKYMCAAEDKIFDRLESSTGNEEKQSTASNDSETERDIDQQFLQMATSICGAQHWTTHFMSLSLIEESLASFNSTLMTMGQDPDKDAEIMDELFVEIAEAADGIERAYAFASLLELNLDPAHWLFDYTVGLARTLVGLGDEKSQKYGSTWIEKVEKYARYFENDGMNKVVVALRDAWKRGKTEEETGGKDIESGEEDQTDCKRRKTG